MHNIAERVQRNEEIEFIHITTIPSFFLLFRCDCLVCKTTCYSRYLLYLSLPQKVQPDPALDRVSVQQRNWLHQSFYNNERSKSYPLRIHVRTYYLRR